jgi:hypothetical protein
MSHSSVGFAGAGRNHDVGFYFPRYTDTVSFLTLCELWWRRKGMKEWTESRSVLGGKWVLETGFFVIGNEVVFRQLFIDL